MYGRDSISCFSIAPEIMYSHMYNYNYLFFLVYSLYSKTEEKGTCLVGPGSKYGYYVTILQSDYLDDHAHVNIYLHLRIYTWYVCICARINIS